MTEGMLPVWGETDPGPGSIALAAWQHEIRVPKGMPGAGRWVHGLPAFPGRQLTLPGLQLAHREQVRADLERAIAADHEYDTKPGEDVTFETPGNNYFGNTADTDIVDFDDGSTWVRKRGIRETSINHEIAYSMVSDVLGAGAPTVIQRTDPQTGTDSIWMPYVNGQTAIEWTDGYDPEEAEAEGGGTAYEEYDPEGAYIGQRGNWSGNDPEEMYHSDQGLLIGLADMITRASDRHLGNWIIDHGQPVPIDNESADFGYGAWAGTPFAEALAAEMGGFADQHEPEEWDRWLTGLQNLEEEFDAMGMRAEWQSLLLNFREVREMAGA